MTELRSLPKLSRISPYVGGKAALDANRPTFKLSSNENPLGPSPRAVDAITRAAATAHLYPDGAAAELRSALGARFALDPARIRIGAGSDELIGLLALAYAGPGDEVLYPEHGFLMYRIAALLAGAEPIAAPERERRCDVDALLAAVTERTKIVFLANPNNPTGSAIGVAELERLRAGLPERVLLAVDGAYAEYVDPSDAERCADGLALAQRTTNTVVTRTFSKLFGLAGLRLGWCFAAPSICDALDRARGPFNSSSIAQAAGIAALEDLDHQRRSVEHNRIWRERLRGELGALGLDVAPSFGNFLAIDFGSRRAMREAAARLEGAGVIARDIEAYGLETCLRLSIGTSAANMLAIETLARYWPEIRDAA